MKNNKYNFRAMIIQMARFLSVRELAIACQVLRTNGHKNGRTAVHTLIIENFCFQKSCSKCWNIFSLVLWPLEYQSRTVSPPGWSCDHNNTVLKYRGYDHVTTRTLFWNRETHVDCVETVVLSICLNGH